MFTVKGNFPISTHLKKFLIATATINAFTRNVNKTMNERAEC